MRHSRFCFDSIVLLGHGRDETVGHRPRQHFTDGGHERLLSLLRPDQNHHAGLSGTQRANRLPGRSQKIRSFLFDANFERPTGEVAQESRAGLHVGPIGQQLVGSGDAHDHRQRFRHVHHDGVRDRPLHERLRAGPVSLLLHFRQEIHFAHRHHLRALSFAIRGDYLNRIAHYIVNMMLFT